MSKKTNNRPDRWSRNMYTEPPEAKFTVGSPHLHLPSFGVNITRSDPEALVWPTERCGPTIDISVEGGDACSVSYDCRLGTYLIANQSFMNLDAAYLRRLLLHILDKEEYDSVREYHDEQCTSFWVHGKIITREPDPRAQVRITDLRLANDLRPIDLQRELSAELYSLPLPVSADGVARWKWETLRKPKDLRTRDDLRANEKWYEEECTRVKAVSFAAASLYLFVDLDMRKLKEARHQQLAKHIRDLAEIVRTLIAGMDHSVASLTKLLAHTGNDGRRPDPGIKYLTALVWYRMGIPLDQIARRVGLNAPTLFQGEAGYSKNWKQKVEAMIMKGIEVEEEIFPQAVEEVFARRDQEVVQEKARRAYDEHFSLEMEWQRSEDQDRSASISAENEMLIGVPVDEQEVLNNALIQLGACLVGDRDPLPTLS